MATSWLTGGYASTEGLVIPGRPHRSTATIRLAEDGLSVSTEDARATLSWGDAGEQWEFCGYTLRRGGGTGVSLRVWGSCADETTDVHKSTQTLANRIQEWMNYSARSPSGDEEYLPLYATHVIGFTAIKEQETLQQLCLVLKAEASVRTRLADPVRVERLLADLCAHPQNVVARDTAVRRIPTEIQTAMRSLQIVHPYGRPVPGLGPAWTSESATEAVLNFIAASPWAKGIEVSPRVVAHYLDDHFFKLAPWPFAALTT